MAVKIALNWWRFLSLLACLHEGGGMQRLADRPWMGGSKTRPFSSVSPRNSGYYPSLFLINIDLDKAGGMCRFVLPISVIDLYISCRISLQSSNPHWKRFLPSFLPSPFPLIDITTDASWLHCLCFHHLAHIERLSQGELHLSRNTIKEPLVCGCESKLWGEIIGLALMVTDLNNWHKNTQFTAQRQSPPQSGRKPRRELSDAANGVSATAQLWPLPTSPTSTNSSARSVYINTSMHIITRPHIVVLLNL